MGIFRQFPYSNFHEMNMDEIIKIVKNMLEEWAQYHAEWDAWMNQMNDDWSNYQEVMNEAWQNMQNFINNYFDNLDVQTEINNKITSMVNTGEFADIVAPYIPPRVTEWLSAHITEPVGVVIDTSLSVAGACADAKATGDAIANVRSYIGNIDYITRLFEIGNINISSSGWSYTTTDARVRVKQGTSLYMRKGTVVGLTDYTDARYYLGWRKPDGTYGSQGWLTHNFTLTETGDYVVLIGNLVDTVQTNVEDLASLFFGYQAIAFDYINEYYNDIKNLSNIRLFEHDGFITSSGYISDNHDNGEKYTDKIGCKPGDIFTMSIDFGTPQNAWCQYALYDKNGTFLERVSIIEMPIVSKTASFEIVNQYAEYIAFCYRTFTSAIVNVYTTNRSDDKKFEIMTINNNVTALTKLNLSEYPGYITGTGSINPASENQEVYTNKVGCKKGDKLKITLDYGTEQQGWFGYALYDKLGNFINRTLIWNRSMTINTYTLEISSDNAQFIAFTYRTFGVASISIFLDGRGDDYKWQITEIDKLTNFMTGTPIVNSINHRGYNTIAPENTIPAFKLSKIKGFPMVETDVAFTSDNVPVCLHDDSINRTARNDDGTTIETTIYIDDITYAQALQYDFGIWKGSEYTGTRIPTFEQFFTLCRNLSLHPYVEVKRGTQTQVENLIDLSIHCGLKNNVTWISSQIGYLTIIKNYDSTARLGLVTSSVDSTVITNVSALKTSDNEVFIDNVTADTGIASLCKDAGIPLEVWNENSVTHLTSLPTYVTGVTSDTLIASYELYKASII